MTAEMITAMTNNKVTPPDWAKTVHYSRLTKYGRNQNNDDGWRAIHNNAKKVGPTKSTIARTETDTQQPPKILPPPEPPPPPASAHHLPWRARFYHGLPIGIICGLVHITGYSNWICLSYTSAKPSCRLTSCAIRLSTCLPACLSGRGCNPTGFHTRKGGYRIDPYRVVHFVVPELGPDEPVSPRPRLLWQSCLNHTTPTPTVLLRALNTPCFPMSTSPAPGTRPALWYTLFALRCRRLQHVFVTLDPFAAARRPPAVPPRSPRRPSQLKPYVSYKAAKVVSSVSTPEDVLGLGLGPDAGDQVSCPWRGLLLAPWHGA